MKIDGLGVVLAIILLPIILIVTFYIQLQVDTIATENSYNTKLLNATYDAMSAFEINTANEELSSNADSMRSIILASNNVLLNTLATNFGMSNASKENLQPYIPAVLYTMYDGYYIYAPTETPVIAEKTEIKDGLTTTKGALTVEDLTAEDREKLESDAVYGDIVYKTGEDKYTVNKDKAKKKTDYILKSYVQYSARYKTDDNKIDVTINYTLDNYLNIIGTINDVYYTKTGYLIKQGLVQSATDNLLNYNLLNYNETDAINKILGVETHVEATRQNAIESVTINVDDVEIMANWGTINSVWDTINEVLKKIDYPTYPKENIKTIQEAETYLKKANEEAEIYLKDVDKDDKEKVVGAIQNLKYEIEKYKAIAYYVSSQIFSDWVYNNLNILKYQDIQDDAITEYFKNGEYKSTLSKDDKSDLYYDFKENSTTIFDVNQDPEQFNSNFNTHKMEVIKNSIKYNLNLAMSSYNNMDKRLKDYKASMPVLLDEEWDKILSNISIVSFMQGWDCGLDIYNNYQIVSSTNNELTVTPSEIYYVKKEEFNNSDGQYHRIDCQDLVDSAEYISFKSKEVKYDKIYDKYASGNPYKYDHRNLACYRCINTNNYDGIGLSDNKKIAKYIGIANARQSTYKTNALPVSEGYKIINVNKKITTKNNENYRIDCEFKEIKQLQITISNTISDIESGSKEPVLKLKILNQEKTIVLDSEKEQTIIVDVDKNSDEEQVVEINKISPSYNVIYDIKSIKAIYK